jgi:CO dehydrogenase/acetyl-CoA synthase alpha subunit
VTLTLDAPTLDVTLLEERQPDVPLVCTRGGAQDDVADPCDRIAKWEALCFGCGHIFRRCPPHYDEDLRNAKDPGWEDTEWYDVCHKCAICEAKVYIQQYGRLPS